MLFLYCAKSNNGLRYCLLVTYGTIFYKNSRATPQLTSPQPNLFYCFIDSRHCTKSSLFYSWTLNTGRSIFALPLPSLPAWILQSSLWNCLHNVRGDRRGVQQNVPTDQQIPLPSFTPQIFISAVGREHTDRIVVAHWWGNKQHELLKFCVFWNVMPCNLTIATAGFYGCSSIYARVLDVTFKKTASSQSLSQYCQAAGGILLSLGVLLHTVVNCYESVALRFFCYAAGNSAALSRWI